MSPSPVATGDDAPWNRLRSEKNVSEMKGSTLRKSYVLDLRDKDTKVSNAKDPEDTHM